MGDEGAGLRRQSKRTAELIAGDGDCVYSSKGQGQGDDAERGPGKVGEFDQKVAMPGAGTRVVMKAGSEAGACHRLWAGQAGFLAERGPRGSPL